MSEVANRAIQDLKIATISLGVGVISTERDTDIQSHLLNETRHRLFGRNVSARGSIMSVHDELWFFPSQLQMS